MKTQSIFSRGAWQAALIVSLAALAIVLAPGPVMAQNILLQSGDSSAMINPGDGSGLVGMNSWVADGGNQLDDQWFYYSVYNGTSWSSVQSIEQLGNFSIQGQTASSVTLQYESSTIAVQVTYSLSGNNSGGNMSESVNVFNLSSANLGINFYQYANFNLLQNNANTINILGSQMNGFSSVYQTTTGDGNGIEETIDAPFANYGVAGNPTDVLNDVSGGTDLSGPTSANGDVAWAFEWNSSVAPFDNNVENAWGVLQNQNMSIQPVPEPGTLCLIGLGLAACGFARRARNRNI